ncbi:hypothetical protein Godav_011185 [Gossypium davidsonii]|uniref:Uncharacterized protein n=1 Tax=Gossypium davidsonii TaxID=34287 RepID=A0A7J8R965_GOSDV|nr:hypothetical protein [Gossypium davidsonii]
MAIWRIASCVGRLIHIDRNTEDVRRGRFCGKFGHREDSCSMSTIAATDTDKVPSSSTHVESDMPLITPLHATETSFGLWILVQRKMHKPAPSNPIVNSNHVPSPLKDVGQLASIVVSKDMATSSTGPDLLPPQRPPSKMPTGLVCNESSLVSSSVNNAICSSVASLKARCNIKELVRLHRVHILIIIEPRINGENADKDVMVTRQLMQIDASGCKFIWSNGQYVNGLIRKKLDRLFAIWRGGKLLRMPLLETSLILINHANFSDMLQASWWYDVALSNSLLSLQEEHVDLNLSWFCSRTTVPLVDQQLAQILHIRHDHEIHLALKSMAPW